MVPSARLELALRKRQGFSYHYSFRYTFVLWSGLYLKQLSFLVSSLYTLHPFINKECLGSVLAVKLSPNLLGYTFKFSLEALKLNLSPLCLPISPRGHEGSYNQTFFHLL